MTQEAIAVSTTPPLPGLQMVQQVNAALQTIATDFAGPNDPAALAGPYMTWADTGNMLLKRRNAANSAWVSEGPMLDSMYGRSNILAPLGMAAGVPTGGLWQVSSTATGTLFRNASGQQICTFRAPNFALRAMDAAFGQVFGAANLVTWPFPAAFSEPPVVLPFSLSTGRWATAGSPALTQCDIRIYSYALDATFVGHQFTAIGRWF